MDQRLSEEDARIWGAFGTLDVPPLSRLNSLLAVVAGHEKGGAMNWKAGDIEKDLNRAECWRYYFGLRWSFVCHVSSFLNLNGFERHGRA